MSLHGGGDRQRKMRPIGLQSTVHVSLSKGGTGCIAQRCKDALNQLAAVCHHVGGICRFVGSLDGTKRRHEALLDVLLADYALGGSSLQLGNRLVMLP